MTTNPLRTEAIKLLAEGMKPHEVSAQLDVPESLLTTWELDGEVASERSHQIDEIDKKMQAEANAMFGVRE